jgi:cell division protein FtsB
MREFQDKKKNRKRLYSIWSLLALLVVIVLFGKGVVSAYEKEKSTKEELNRLAAEKVDIERRYNNISKENETLNTNDGIESAIRQKFDVAKKGEGVIVIVDKTVEVPEVKKGFMRKVWDSVKGVFQ